MKRVAIAALALLVLGGTAASSMAQTFGQELGSLYLSRSQTEYQPNLGGAGVNGAPDEDPIASFQNFSFYIVTEIDYADIGLGNQNGAAGLQAWEAAIDLGEAVGLTVLSRTMFPGGAGDLGNGNDNWVVFLGSQVTALSTPFVLVEYSGGFFGGEPPSDILVPIGSSSPSSFNPPVPGWNEGVALGECTLNGNPIKCLRPYAFTGRMTINCVTQCLDVNNVSTETPSWGAIKANYGEGD
jgi:hypothetical protein